MKGRLAFFGPVIVVCALAVIISRLGIPAPIDRALLETRMAYIDRAPSGQVVFVAIDAESLDLVGSWPWSRSTHAELLDFMTDAGARDVFLDVDFSFPRDDAGDAAFVAALSRAQGSTLLPIFAQARSVGDTMARVNSPLPDFANQSWPALVNVVPDIDGFLRHYPFGETIEGMPLASAASLMSGILGPDDTSFLINYAIDPHQIPTYAFSDVIGGAVPAEAFADRSVIVGALAVELRDNFAVPVHGILAGGLVHALAAETLITGPIPVRLMPAMLLPVLVLMLILLQFHTKTQQLVPLLRTSVIYLGLIETAAYFAFAELGLIVPTGLFYPSVLTYGTWRMGHALDLNKWMMQVQQVKLENTVDILGQVFADSSDAILVVDNHGSVLHHSNMAAEIFGLDTNKSPIMPTALDWAAANAIAAFQDGKWQPDRMRELSLGQGEAKRLIAYTVTPSLVQADTGDAASHIATIAARDVTETRRQAAQIDYLSTHDERTGALRRGAFLRELSRAKRSSQTLTLFAINLHRFKTINVTLGRDIGDQVLRQTVARLRGHSANFGEVLRVDGDSFAVFLANLKNPSEALRIADDIVRSVTAPFKLDGARAQVGLRVGVAFHPVDRSLSGPMLMDQAEEALDNARMRPGNRVELYDFDTGPVRVRSRAIEQSLGSALLQNQLSVLYQPQVCMQTGALHGVEALIRWTHPELGKIGPDEFITIAESNGYIQELGRWVLRQSMLDGLRLPDHVSMAINVSPIQMQNGNIVKDVSSILEQTKFPAERLWLELTESTLLTPDQDIIGAMSEIEDLGVAWALDDFGTGFSSLNYMSMLPISKLKVDRAFVETMEGDASGLAIIRSVQVMCEGLGIAMLCEGIETEKQAQILRDENCTEGQGYLYGRPQTIDDILAKYPAPYDNSIARA